MMNYMINIHIYMYIYNKEYIKKQSRKFYCNVKEELVAVVWYPRRVEKLVEQYGLDVLEAF